LSMSLKQSSLMLPLTFKICSDFKPLVFQILPNASFVSCGDAKERYRMPGFLQIQVSSSSDANSRYAPKGKSMSGSFDPVHSRLPRSTPNISRECFSSGLYSGQL